MPEQRPSDEFEEQVRQAWATPEPDPAFAANLRAQLARGAAPVRPAPGG